jgi:hypothetical protein
MKKHAVRCDVVVLCFLLFIAQAPVSPVGLSRATATVPSLLPARLVNFPTGGAVAGPGWPRVAVEAAPCRLGRAPLLYLPCFFLCARVWGDDGRGRVKRRIMTRRP